jgi:hypothetical protein
MLQLQRADLNNTHCFTGKPNNDRLYANLGPGLLQVKITEQNGIFT